MGFSWIGLCIAAAVLLPNLLMLILPPRNMPEGLRDAHVLFTVLENLGRIAFFVILIFFCKDRFRFESGSAWLTLMLFCILVYYGLWVRYAVTGHEYSLLLRPLWFIPVPMAVFPILAFAFSAAWGHSPPLGIAAAVFAVGHIVNSHHSYLSIK